MYEESIRFFTDLFRATVRCWRSGFGPHVPERSVAKHYGIPGVTGDEWRRSMREDFLEGGILGQLPRWRSNRRLKDQPHPAWQLVAEALLGEAPETAQRRAKAAGGGNY